MNNSKRIPIILGVVSLFVLILSWSSLTYTIEAGHRGIIFRPFTEGGIDTNEMPLRPGFHFIAPWNSMVEYNTQLQETEQEMNALSSDGLDIQVEVSIRCRPIIAQIPQLHTQIGSEYTDKIVIPQIREMTRNVIGQYTPEQLYSSKRDEIQSGIFNRSRDILRRYYIELDAILIRGIKLPQSIRAAIEKKLKAEQESQEYDILIAKEKKVAERMQIEARRIKAYNDTITKGLTPELLRWKGIEATLELAKSPNTKVVVVGNEKGGGLPLILGGDK